MLRLALLFLIIALIAGALNVWPVAALSVDIARILSIVFLAVLLTFVLTPLVLALQRRGLGRVVSVSLVVVLAFSAIGGIGAAVLTEMKNLAIDLPDHKQQIIDKINDLRNATKGPWLDSVYDTMDGIVKSIKGPMPAPNPNLTPPKEDTPSS